MFYYGKMKLVDSNKKLVARLMVIKSDNLDRNAHGRWYFVLEKRLCNREHYRNARRVGLDKAEASFLTMFRK